jgi:hypothetical protein
MQFALMDYIQFLELRFDFLIFKFDSALNGTVW